MKQLIEYTDKVEKYLWHMSWPKHRESILKNGLVPQPFEKSWWKSESLYYPPSVFVDNHSNYGSWFYASEFNWNTEYFCDMDFWRIDTTDLNNTWYYDFNLYMDGSSLFTMEVIESENIQLFKPCNIDCFECKTLICGLPIEIAFSNIKNEINEQFKRIHHLCLCKRENESFDLEELAYIKGLNRLGNLPSRLEEKIDLILVD